MLIFKIALVILACYIVGKGMREVQFQARVREYDKKKTAEMAETQKKLDAQYRRFHP